MPWIVRAFSQSRNTVARVCNPSREQLRGASLAGAAFLTNP